MKKMSVLFFMSIIVPVVAAAEGVNGVEISQQRIKELDAYWSEVSRCVNKGDFEGYRATCHPDGVLVAGTRSEAYPLAIALMKWQQGFRDRQEITWTFACPIAPHLGSLLNRKIRDVERLRLWFRSIGRDPIWGTLGPQIVQLISCRSLIDTKSGKIKASVSFRFSQRLGDETTAHETGMFLYSTVSADGKTVRDYIHFEALLIKKKDWKIMMEYQKSKATEEEWNKLK